MTTTVPAEIATFAECVRAELSDLPAEEVEADLAEAFREDLARELGDPSAYAAELRSAAGLPGPSRDARGPGAVASSIDTVRGLGRDVRSFVVDQPALSTVAGFVASLRPAWWLVRGWVAWVCLGEVTGFGTLFALVLLVLGSVWLGLRTWPTWFGAAIVAGNAVAAAVLLAMTVSLPTFSSSSDDVADGVDLPGLYLDGTQVTNVFAYDTAGQPLTGVQLFDQDGHPLATTTDGGSGCLDPDCLDYGLWLPMELVTGEKVYNVYPMATVEAEPDAYDELRPLPGASAIQPTAPFRQVPAVSEAQSPAAGPAEAPAP